MKLRLLIALCVGLAAPLAHAQTSTASPAPTAPGAAPASPGPAPGTSAAPAPAQSGAPTQPAAATAPGQRPVSAPQGTGGVSSGQSAPATTDPTVTGTTGPTTTTQTSTSGGAAAVPADNAQLNNSITGQNATRQGGLGGTRDNALAERQRQTAQFATAPAAAAPGNAQNNAVYGAPAPGSAPTLNQADRGPVPGSDYATASGVTSNVYIVRTAPQPSATGAPAGGVVSGAAQAPGSVPANAGAASDASAGNARGASTPAAGDTPTGNASARTTRIYTYGPGGGDNVVGMMRLAEMQGQFRYSRGERARAERKRQQASAESRRR